MSDFIMQVNAVSVPVDLLIEANQIHTDLPPEDRSDMAVWVVAWIQMLESKPYTEAHRSDLLLALHFRMTALASLELAQHAEMAGWSMPGDKDGMVFAHYELFQAAAAHPVVEIDNQAAFEPDSFFQRLLSITETKGNG